MLMAEVGAKLVYENKYISFSLSEIKCFAITVKA